MGSNISEFLEIKVMGFLSIPFCYPLKIVISPINAWRQGHVTESEIEKSVSSCPIAFAQWGQSISEL